MDFEADAKEMMKNVILYQNLDQESRDKIAPQVLFKYYQKFYGFILEMFLENKS